MTERVRSIAILGERADVWPVAAMLARQLPADLAISVVEDRGSQDEVAAIPLADPFFKALGIGAADIAGAGGGFSLGYRLEGFVAERSQTIVALSGDLPAIGGLAFHHVLRRVAQEAKALDRFTELYSGFRFCTRAAADGRMALPGDAPDSPLAMLGPLVVIDRGRLADLLEGIVESGRVSRVAADAAATECADSADFMIDLRNEAMDERTIDLPLLSAAKVEADLQPAAMPLYRVTGEGDEVRSASSEPWQGNRLRMGRASASMGPLFSADTRLLLRQVMHLAECLPHDTAMVAEARRFNHLHRQSVARLYELAAAPLHLNRRPEPHWQALRQPEPPECLALRIDQFRHRGRMPEFDGEVVDRQFWIDLLISFGIVPACHDRRADAFDPRQLDRALGTIRQQLDQALAAMPTERQFMTRFAAT